MNLWAAGVFVATLACLAYIGPGDLSANASTYGDSEPKDELCGFDELNPRHYMRKNIRKAFQSYYQHLAISYCFQRHNVSLPGFERLFRSYSEMERGNAENLMNYMIKRGMTFPFESISVNGGRFIQCYERDDMTGNNAWDYVMKVMDFALRDQKDRLNMYLKTHNAATMNNFPHLKLFIEDGFLEQKFHKIKEIADHQTRLRRLRRNDSPELGLYIFDRELPS